MTDEEKRFLEQIQKQNAEAHADTRRHFVIVAEGLKRDIQLLAETVAHVDSRVDATNANVERTAAETQGLIKLSHSNLNRRVKVLETGNRQQKRHPR
jgi:hypothetical protein